MFLFVFTFSLAFGEPISVHLSMFNDVDGSLRVVVGWVDDSLINATVFFGPGDDFVLASPGTAYDRDSGYNYFAVLPALDAGGFVNYRIGEHGRIRKFKNPNLLLKSFKAWVVGDFGIDNAGGTAAALNRRVNEFDFCVHPGDISYANDHPFHYETWWRQWWTSIEVATTMIPYMAGNTFQKIRFFLLFS